MKRYFFAHSLAIDCLDCQVLGSAYFSLKTPGRTEQDDEEFKVFEVVNIYILQAHVIARLGKRNCAFINESPFWGYPVGKICLSDFRR
jgi:hypothetical protein